MDSAVFLLTGAYGWFAGADGMESLILLFGWSGQRVWLNRQMAVHIVFFPWGCEDGFVTLLALLHILLF